MLRKFMEGQAGAPARIVAALDVDDWQGAERFAHTLKGTAATIGATGIQEIAARLEASIKAHEAREKVKAMVDEIALPLAIVVNALRESLPAEATPTAQVPSDPAQLKVLAAQLAARLADGDAEASDLLAEHADIFRAAFGDHYTQLEDGIRNFDFERALTALQAAMAAQALAQ
jgi:two-component system sensor histidine kinase/response regulator